jgi:hypothetical protein
MILHHWMSSFRSTVVAKIGTRSVARSIYTAVTLALVFGEPSRPIIAEGQPESTSVQTSDSGERKKLIFKRGISGDVLQGGELLGFTDYEASDGVRLRMLYKNFDDGEQASAMFNSEIGRAVKVLKRGPKRDADGRIVGERAQLFLATPTEGQAAVLWTNGRRFHEIQSKSLPDILELEKIYKY